VTAFTIPANASKLTVPISSFTATDDVGVTGYMVNESAVTPSPTAGGWSATAPTSYTFTTVGNKTLYAWAKDAAGNVSTSKNASVKITLMESAGWYAGDMHVHRSCGGPPETVDSMYQKMSPQNLTFISLLADMGDGEVQDPVLDLPRVNGQDDPVSTSGQIVHWDAEWHWDPAGKTFPQKALGGHVVALGLTEAHQIWEEYTYPIFDWAHQQNGIAGFAHMQYLDNSIPQSLSCCTPIEYPVEVALGSADFISEDDFGSESAIQAYYRLLNTGFRPGFAAGTDYPCNNPDVGSLLTYVQVAGGEMTYRNWIEGIAQGRTVISRNGHNEFLNLTVNGNATPGDEINLTGAGSAQVKVIWTANQPLSGTIELVSNGIVVATKSTSVNENAPSNLTATVNFTKSGWLAARRMDGANGHQVQTAAVFVTVNNAPVRTSATDAEFYVQWMDNLLVKTNDSGPNGWNQYFHGNNLSLAQARYRAAKAIYQQIGLEAGLSFSPPSPVNDTEVSSRRFNITSNQTVNVTWYINGTLVQNNFTTKAANYTNTSAKAGIWNVSARVNNINGSKMLTWIWNVTVNAPPASYIPPVPTGLVANNQLGSFWVNYTWQPGSGNITNSYNVSVNNTWHNGSSSTYYNDSILAPHSWSNISVYSYNNSGTGTMNITPISRNKQVDNHVPVLDPIGDKTVISGNWLNFTISATDIDSDLLTYGSNNSQGTLDPVTGNYSWLPGSPGNYVWYFNSSDKYGGVATETITVTVNEVSSVSKTVTLVANNTGNTGFSAQTTGENLYSTMVTNVQVSTRTLLTTTNRNSLSLDDTSYVARTGTTSRDAIMVVNFTLSNVQSINWVSLKFVGAVTTNREPLIIGMYNATSPSGGGWTKLNSTTPPGVGTYITLTYNVTSQADKNKYLLLNGNTLTFSFAEWVNGIANSGLRNDLYQATVNYVSSP
jgi:hypothetical protein